MIAKKIIVFLIIVAALSSGWYFFQTDKQKKELMSHNALKFQQITAAAKENNAAGLRVMASAINKYHKKKGHYPVALLDLYPDFIMDKSFILTLDWKYDQKNKGYLIKRAIKGQKTFASMGPELKLKTGRLEATKQPAALASARPRVQETKPVKTDTFQNAKLESKITPKDNVIQTIKKKSSPGIKPVLTDENQTLAEKNIQTEPSIRIGKALDKDETFLLSFNNSRFYIWKSKNGTIGFSNIQYPDKKQLTIFRNQRWIEYGAVQNTTPKK